MTASGRPVAANPRLRGRSLRAGQNVVVPTLGPLPVEVARQLAVEPSDGDFHRVRRGENLRLIAGRYGVTQHQLQVWNRMGKATRVRVGQRLRVAPPESAVRTTARANASAAARQAAARSHVVRPGETLAGLAKRYGVSVQALRDANGLSEAATLKRGLRLKIPA